MIVLLLPNQAWVCLPVRSKANLLTQVVAKESAVFTAGQARGPGSSKALNSPVVSRERLLKVGVRERVAGSMISSWTFFCLVGCEVIRSPHHQPSGSNLSGVSVLVGGMQLTFSSWWGFQNLQNSSMDLAQNIIYIALPRRNQRSLTLFNGFAIIS